MGLSNSTYEHFFGSNFSKLDNCEFPKLRLDTDREFVKEYFLKSVFLQEYDTHKKYVVYYFLRRVQQIITFYNEARESFENLSLNKKDRLSAYVETLNYLELTITLAYQNHGILVSKSTKLFENKDNTPIQRLNRCYNQIKHLDHDKFNLDAIQSTYIDNDRFCTSDSYITFVELRDIIDKLICAAINLVK